MYRNNQQGHAVIALVFILLWVAAVFGWVLNIVEVFNTVNLPVTAMFILRCIGIFVAPLGAILGYV